MAPKRRPAADGPRGRGRDEEPPVRRRGGVRLRRPAREGEAPAEGRHLEAGRSFEEGVATPCHEIPIDSLRKRLAIHVRGRYWSAPGEISGLVRGVQVRSKEDIEVEVELQGTNTETILRWASGAAERVMRVHLCGCRCTDMIDSENLLHGEEMSVRKGEDLAWMTNLTEAGDPAEAKAAAEPPLGEGKEKEGKGKERSRGRSREAEKKKKKKKRERSSEKRSKSSGEGKSSKEKAKKQLSIKHQAKKTPKSVYGGTGMDPDPKVRKKVAARAARRLKKKKKSSSASSSSGSSSEESDEESDELFEETQKVRKVGRVAPGALTAAGCKEMATNLLSSTGGIWDQTEGPLQPICCQYFRQVLSSRVSGGQAREALTLSWCLDLLIQARAAEAADGLMQRLKSLEMASQGAAWSVAQRVELIPAEKPIISSRAEAREAIKENKEESRTRADASKGKHKGEAWSTSWRDSSWQTDKGKGKEVKGKGKKGKEKDQGKKQE